MNLPRHHNQLNPNQHERRAWRDAYLASIAPSRAPRTVERAKWALDHFTGFNPDEVVTPELLIAWQQATRSAFAPSTACLHSTIIRGFCRWLFETGRTVVNVHAGIKTLPVAPGPERRIIDEATFLRYISRAWPEFRWLIMLGYYAGLGMRDALTLRWAEVNIDEKMITRPRAKSHGRRPFVQRVPMHPQLLELYPVIKERFDKAVEAGKVHYGNPYLLPLQAKRDPRSVWGNIYAHIGVHGVRFHDLRANFITRLVRNKVSLPVAMAMSGHRSTQVFSRYAQVDNEMLRDAFNDTLPPKLPVPA